MPKTAKSAEPTLTRDLTPDRTTCPHCGGPIPADDTDRRTAEFQRRRRAIARGLEATAGLWPPVRVAFGWVHPAAHLLGLEGTPRSVVRGTLGGRLGTMVRHREAAGD